MVGAKRSFPGRCHRATSRNIREKHVTLLQSLHDANVTRNCGTASRNRARTADNKIHLLRPLRCRGSSGARPCAPKIAAPGQAGAWLGRAREALRAHAPRKSHKVLNNGLYTRGRTSGEFRVERNALHGRILPCNFPIFNFFSSSVRKFFTFLVFNIYQGNNSPDSSRAL